MNDRSVRDHAAYAFWAFNSLGQGGEDISKMAEPMKKRKSGASGAGETPGESAEQPDVKDMMKQFGEMMKKKQQPQGGQ